MGAAEYTTTDTSRTEYSPLPNGPALLVLFGNARGVGGCDRVGGPAVSPPYRPSVLAIAKPAGRDDGQTDSGRHGPARPPTARSSSAGKRSPRAPRGPRRAQPRAWWGGSNPPRRLLSSFPGLVVAAGRWLGRKYRTCYLRSMNSIRYPSGSRTKKMRVPLLIACGLLSKSTPPASSSFPAMASRSSTAKAT